jgi:membrane protein CcdC involved in cytochrome C biogenesis
MISLYIATTIVALIMGLIILFVRMRAAKKPTNAKKIILPPFFMATGFLMFAIPIFHIDFRYAIGAFLLGNIFSLFLIKSSSFIEKDGDIYMERSKVFMFIILGLIVIRLALKTYINQYVSLYETSSIFFIVAFGMLLPWRLAMYVSFKKLKSKLSYQKEELMS